MALLAVRVKGLEVAVEPSQLCSNPCKARLVLLDPQWRPSAPWGISRYRCIMGIEPVLGAAGGTPLVCPGGSTHCYKLEHVSLYSGFWDRGAETLVAHMELCGVRAAWTRSGPWLQSLRGYTRGRTSILEVEGVLVDGYCADVLHNPFFHEGGATLVYELYEETGVPDALVVPGYPALLESLRVGYERLMEVGVASEPPRIYAVDAGVGIPRWLHNALEIYEVRRPRVASRGAVSLREARLPVTQWSAILEEVRLELLESGELGRDERVVLILL